MHAVGAGDQDRPHQNRAYELTRCILAHRYSSTISSAASSASSPSPCTNIAKNYLCGPTSERLLYLFAESTTAITPISYRLVYCSVETPFPRCHVQRRSPPPPPPEVVCENFIPAAYRPPGNFLALAQCETAARSTSAFIPPPPPPGKRKGVEREGK